MDGRSVHTVGGGPAEDHLLYPAELVVRVHQHLQDDPVGQEALHLLQVEGCRRRRRQHGEGGAAVLRGEGEGEGVRRRRLPPGQPGPGLRAGEGAQVGRVQGARPGQAGKDDALLPVVAVEDVALRADFLSPCGNSRQAKQSKKLRMGNADTHYVSTHRS